MSSATASPGRWYYGAAPDLLLGCGVGYALFFVALSFAGPQIRDALPMGLLPLAILVTGVPHYGATLLRVYEQRKDRRAYAFFSVFASALVWAGFAVSLHNVFLGSLLLTLYLTWSPYHYTGQNYGIALMFLRRRGVPVSPAAKRLIHTSFLLSFGLTALAIHSVAVSANYAPVSYEGTVYHLIPVGIPDTVGNIAMAVLGVAYLASSLAAAALLLRVAPARDLLPAALLALTQALWFSVPVVGRHLGLYEGEHSLSVHHFAYTFMWIGMGHSLQYLWVTTYYAEQSGDANGRSIYWGKTLLAGAAIWVIPGLLFAPAGLGSLPYDAGLAVMISTAVNLQHFVLDGAIWKLRDGRIAKILIRGDRDESAPRPEGLAASRLRVAPAIWVLGALSIGVYVIGTTQLHKAHEAVSERNLERVNAASHWLQRIGRDSAELAGTSALLMLGEGQLEQAISRAEAGLALHEDAAGQRRMGFLYQRGGRQSQAIVAYRRSLELQPEHAQTQNNLAWMLATRESVSAADSSEAIQLAESALRTLGDGSSTALDTLAVAYASAGRFAEARRVAKRALAIAQRTGDRAAELAISQRLEIFRAKQPYRAQ